MTVRVGVDVGGSTVEAVALDDRDRVVSSSLLRTAAGESGVVASVADAIARLGLARSEVPAMASIGVGIPGRVENGVVHDAVNLDVAELDLRSELDRMFGVPVLIGNDVKAAALGAGAVRGASGGRSMGFLNLGTGVAAGILIDGRLWHGAGNVAGEIGHLSIDPNGPVCSCGQRGCIEAFSGGGAVTRRWGRAGRQPMRDVFDEAERGDDEAVALRSGVVRGVAAAVRVLTLAVDPETIVIGGGVSALGARLRRLVVAELRQSAAWSIFLRSLRLDERVEFLEPGTPVGAIGAALMPS